MDLCRPQLARLALLVALPWMAVTGCTRATKPPPGIAITVSPTAARVGVGQQQQFTAMVQNASNTTVTWQIDGVAGGNATVGTISASGLYTAPATVPNPATVTVSAASQADPSRTGSATVTIMAPGTGGTGRSFQICTDPVARAQHLSSPWTYHALAAGSQRYTVAQYLALADYGKSLPPLPSYIADQDPSTDAAIIFAPGASTQAPAYEFPLSPLLYFFEGGAYGAIGFQSVPGDLFIGGSAPGFPEPTFTGGGISEQNGHWDFSGGGSTLASPAPAGATTITTAAPIDGYITTVVFADGTSYSISSASGNSITLSSGLTTAESAGTAVWANVVPPLGNLSAAAARGATTLQTGPMPAPILPWEYLNVGAAGGVLDRVQVSEVSGSAASGYTLTLTEPVSAAASANAPVFYAGPAGNVTVEYLDISQGGGDTTLWVAGGSGWTIRHNNIHDNYAGGASYQTTNASGTAIIGGDHSVIAYNCFQRLGEYALNGGGSWSQFDYNEVDQTPYNPDLSGNGQTGCGKWWGSTNVDVIGNAFTNEGRSVCLWFDNGNTGMLVQDNYFYNIGARAIQNETGFNSAYIGNEFEAVEAGIYLNDSGGWDIPGSRFNNTIVVQGNTFHNAMTGVNIWGASGRSCLNSGESFPNGESSPYCSGGFPQMPPTQQYFTHYQDSYIALMDNGPAFTVVTDQACSSGAPCATVTLSSAPALDDRIGFAGQAPDNCSVAGFCGTFADDPVQTRSTDTTDVSTFTGGGIINVASTAGFPSSGQLMVDTSAGQLFQVAGAVVSYTGTTATTFTGVNLVSGRGTLLGAAGSTILAVQPHQVTAVDCPGGNCAGNAVVTLSPTVKSNLTAGTAVYATGTCPYYVTAAATPSFPKAPNGTSYYDGCMWENRNISVTGNTFTVDPAQLNATPIPEGGTAWDCTTGPNGNCAQNAMGYQYPGQNSAPYNDVTLANAMMSAPSLPPPLDNLNAAGSPLATGMNGDVGPNGAIPYNIVWSGNTYVGDWTFQAYTQAADCPVDWTGTALRWVGGNGNACSGLSVAQWNAIWHQN